MRISRFASVFMFCCGLASAQAPYRRQPIPLTPLQWPKAIHSFDLSAIDKAADPAKTSTPTPAAIGARTTPSPATSPGGPLQQLTERDRYLLYVDLNRASNDPKTALQRKYGDFYAACMNSDLADHWVRSRVQPVLAMIDQLSDKKGLAALVARLEVDEATGTFFRFGSEQDQKNSEREIAGIYQGGLSLPDRDYYILDDEP